MRGAERQIAAKEYRCGKCRGEIQVGQLYYKRREGGKVHNRMTYWNLTWHAIAADCHKQTEGGMVKK